MLAWYIQERINDLGREGGSPGRLGDGSPPSGSWDKATIYEVSGTSSAEAGDSLQIIQAYYNDVICKKAKQYLST